MKNLKKPTQLKTIILINFCSLALKTIKTQKEKQIIKEEEKKLFQKDIAFFLKVETGFEPVTSAL
jgi:hypothetical protein